MPPVPCECFRPFVERAYRLGIGSIQHPAAVAPHVDQANIPEHPQVLRYRGLLQPQRIYNVPHRAFLQREIVQDFPPPRFRHRIESIRRCRRSCHVQQYIPIWEYVKAFFHFPLGLPLINPPVILSV
jgi:hypothetical protein